MENVKITIIHLIVIMIWVIAALLVLIIRYLNHWLIVCSVNAHLIPCTRTLTLATLGYFNFDEYSNAIFCVQFFTALLVV